VNSLASSPYLSIAIAAVIVAFVCYRQLRTSSIREERGLLLSVLVFALGILQTVTFILDPPMGVGWGRRVKRRMPFSSGKMEFV
jgi:uncharacterized membrane protein